MAFDSARREVVMFDGLGGHFYSDTWTWADGEWALRQPSEVPTGRERMGMAYDSATQEVVVFGGTQGDECFFGDTWTWDGTSRTER